jgi:protein-disulfide isomerase
MRNFLPRLLAAALVLLAGMAAAPAARAAEFSLAQRAEIVEILRDALRKDPSILRDAIEAMRTDETRAQAEGARAAIAAVRGELITAADPVLGNPKGDVTVVEFFDVRCGYCRKMHPAMTELLRTDPNVRLVLKDLPILGAASVMGSKALLAAQAQGGYAKLYEVLMAQAAAPTRDSLRADAQRLGLDADRLLREMDSPAIAARIEANLALATKLGVQGTPALVVGDVLIPGAIDLADLQQTVQQARAAGR